MKHFKLVFIGLAISAISWGMGATMKPVEIQSDRIDGWYVQRTVVPHPKYRVLLLPGLLGGAADYSLLMQSQDLASHGIQLVAADPPGFAGQTATAPFDYSINSFANVLSDIESKQNFDLMVGHSFFANVLTEVMKCTGPGRKYLLLSPSLQYKSEPLASRLLNSISRVPIVGNIAWKITYRALDMVLAQGLAHQKPEIIENLVREARKTPPDLEKRLMIEFYNHIEKNGDLATAIRETASHVWFAWAGDRDAITVFPNDIRTIEENPNVTIVEIPDSGHLSMIDNVPAVEALIAKILDTNTNTPPD